MKDAETYMAAVAPALGLTIAPGHREGVARFLSVAAEMAAALDGAAEDDELALAPVYLPPAEDA